MKRKAQNINNTTGSESLPQPQTPYIPRFPETDIAPIAGNPGNPESEGNPPAELMYGTPHMLRWGIASPTFPSEPKPETPPYKIPSPPMD